MTTGYTRIIFGGQELDLKNLNRTKVPGTIKQKVGASIVKHKIPARTIQDWKITANGLIYDKTGTTGTAARIALEALYDNKQYDYSDGLILASMIIEDLKFNDDGNNPLHFEYQISMIEYNQ